MSISKQLSSYIEALRPIIYIQHFDFHLVDEIIEDVRGDRKIREYNLAKGEVHFKTKINPSADTSLSSEIPPLDKFLDQFNTDMNSNSLLVLKDIHDSYTPAVIAQMKGIAERTMNQECFSCPMIIVSTKQVIPQEIEKFVTVFDIPFPDLQKIRSILEDYSAGNPINNDDKEELALAFKGLTEFEINQILFLAYQGRGYISIDDKQLILDEKERSIKKTGLLEAIPTNLNINDIGGLENLVGYLEQKAKIYTNFSKALKHGVEVPKGILIVGMPGCGKSLTAKTSAHLFNAPLLRLDMGKLLGKYVGESEENLRQAIKIAEATTPCVLWIDELEKAFAGIGDSSGGGVTTRLFGYFLTWLQEKTSSVYVVATSNDITTLPPEFLRKGRFDEIFFVDLPGKAERKKIFEVHLKKRKQDCRKLGINTSSLAKMCCGEDHKNEYSGSDIESIVKSAIEMAFIDNERTLTQKDLEHFVKDTTPISKTLSEKISELKKRMEKFKFRPASSADEC